MSLFDEHVAALNDVCLEKFGDTADLMVTGGPAYPGIPVILESARVREGESPGRAIALGIKIADLPANVFPAIGDRFQFEEVPYSVVDLETDEGGIVHVQCRAEFIEPRGGTNAT